MGNRPLACNHCPTKNVYFFLIFPMFFEIAQAAQAGSIDPQATYEISDVIRVSIAVVVLVAGGLSVVFVIW